MNGEQQDRPDNGSLFSVDGLTVSYGIDRTSEYSSFNISAVTYNSKRSELEAEEIGYELLSVFKKDTMCDRHYNHVTCDLHINEFNWVRSEENTNEFND